MGSVWRRAVLVALNRFASRHATRLVDRQQFLAEELKAITKATESRGATPHQTASKTLQELRNDGLLEFLSPGKYLLLDKPLEAESEELSDEALDTAIRADKLTFSSVETGDARSITRRRRGQDCVWRNTVRAARFVMSKITGYWSPVISWGGRNRRNIEDCSQT